jgi:hypothetical protein
MRLDLDDERLPVVMSGVELPIRVKLYISYVSFKEMYKGCGPLISEYPGMSVSRSQPSRASPPSVVESEMSSRS